MSEKNAIALSLKVGFSDGRDRSVLDGLRDKLQEKLQKEVFLPFLMENDTDLVSDSFSLTLEAGEMAGPSELALATSI